METDTKRTMCKDIQNWKIQLLVAIVTLLGAAGQNLTSCCEKVVGPCQNVCEKMSHSANSSDEVIRNIDRFCPDDSTEFWICMNKTIQEVISSSGWWGGECCSLAWAPSCRNACVNAKNMHSLSPACRRSDETKLYECVQKQQEAQWCCSQTISLLCYEACHNAVKQIDNSQIDQAAKTKAFDVCEQSPELMQCLREQTSSTIHDDASKYVPCCHESPDLKCRSTCESILRKTGESREIEAALSRDCGAPALHSALWQCFLRKDSPPDIKDMIPHDVAKLHCCQKATTINCKKLCFNTFNTQWQSNWQKFYTECLGEPQEVELSQCIEEVEAPCWPGCAGLSSCSAMNARVDTLFRACSARADLAAHRALMQYHDPFVTISEFRLPLKNSSLCTPDVWKSVSCVLHVKPCTAKGHSSLLCMEDCLHVVSACVDWSKNPSQLTAHALCSRLAPRTENAPCVSLNEYMTPSLDPPLLSSSEMVTSPCAGSPCNASQVCEVNRSCVPPACTKYKCVDGCPLGDNSPVVVPMGSWARVPMPGPDKSACFKICKCGRRGLGNCQPLPCVVMDNCKLHSDKIIMNGEKYWVECNACACVCGERVCARRACVAGAGLGAAGRGAAGAGAAGARWPLPCRCPPHYLPVAAPGRAFPNACLAKCAGVTDAQIEFGTRPLCEGISCPRRHACVPHRNVCLPNGLKQNCDQHVCVNTSNCNMQPPSPACDSDGHTHINPCHLIMSGRRFAYWGECLINCKKVGTVCGINGVTYSSECAAWSEYVSVDYTGSCAAVGPIADVMEPKCKLDNIVCPPLKKRGCLGFTAPGACCPKCGGALRILYSKKQIDRALYGTNMSAAVINLRNIIMALDRHVKIAECALRGYLTIETEIFVTVESVLDNPTDLQLRMCVLEAEKIADLINRDSALFSSDLGLSALSYALAVHSYPTQGASYIIISKIFLIFSTILTYVIR